MQGKIKHSFLILLLSVSISALSQITVDFNAALYGRSLDGIAFAQMNNVYTQKVYAALKISVRDLRQGLVATIRTPFMFMAPGLTTLGNQSYSKSNFAFAQNAIGSTINQTGKFPEGEYEFCFEVTVTEYKNQQVLDVTDFCFQSVVEPMAPIMLINPAPEDVMCNTRPDFTWQPPVPFYKGAQYRIVVSEKGEKQTDVEAIAYNIPVINIGGLFMNTLFYPSKTPELKKGKKYVWQVTAYQAKTILSQSEIWSFEVNCEEEKKKDDTESYREVKETLDGSVYYAYGKLRFYFSNPYNEGKVNYTIISLSGKQAEIKKLPELRMASGHNQFEIELADVKGIEADKDYLLKVWLADNKMLQLHFVYKETK